MGIGKERKSPVRMVYLILAIALAVQAEQPTSAPATATSRQRPAAAEGREFVVEAEMPYRAALRATGIFINAFHQAKPAKDVVESIKSRPKTSRVTVIVCRGAQEQAIRDYENVTDQFIFEALFLLPDWNPPPRDTLLWPGYDHPMINYVRKIRTATKGKSAIVSVPMTSRELWGVSRTRPESFDELKWMAMAVIGANYHGILWGHVRHEPRWNEMLQVLTDQIKAHASDLGAAAPVNWVKAPSGQPVSALASENKLFIVLLNPDFMKVSDDKQHIAGALNPSRRKGSLTLGLPPGVSIVGQTALTLDGASLALASGGSGLTCPYDFTAGGETIVVPIRRVGATQP